MKATVKTGKIRKFSTILSLSIITLGVYFFYWLYITINEIRRVYFLKKVENDLTKANILFYAYLLVSIMFFVSLFFFLHYQKYEKEVLYLIFLPGAIVRVLFFFYFTSAVALAQQRAGIRILNRKNIFNVYLAGLFITFIGSILSLYFISLFGAILIWIFIFKIQNEINKIWIEI